MSLASIRKKGWGILTQWMDVRRLRQHEDKVLLVLTLMIGAIVGLVIVAFILLTENLGARMYPVDGAPWRRLVVPVAGSLVTGFLLCRYFPGARGSGIPQTKIALFLNSGIIQLRTVLGKFWCSSVSLASGIALGREGPSVQVGAGIASVLGRQFGLSPAGAKALVPIGTSAALAAAFNTPIAAVLFTLEEILGNLHAKVLGAIVISSATSWMVLHLLLGDEPLFHVPAYQLVHPVEFIFYAALGSIGGLISAVFVKLLLRLRTFFYAMPAWTLWLQPAAGGLFVGALGLFIPAVLGVGYGHVGEALNGRIALGTMAGLVVLKLLATATCYASGNAGGIFGPSLFIGAMMGGAFGAGAHLVLPDYTGSVGAYALVGMGVAFAGIIRAPMTSVIMIFEITRDYSIIVPLMIANLMSYFISGRLQKRPIYDALMDQDGIRLPDAIKEKDTSITGNDGDNDEDETFSPAAARPAAVGGIIAVLVLVIAIAGFLSYYYRSQRVVRAEQYASSGNELMIKNRYAEAIEQYRSALSISHSSRDRLALAKALIKAGRWNEAELYLKELAREEADSGPVNLGLGRIAAQRGDIPKAIHFYHKSIYGRWPDSSPSEQAPIRIELIKFLGKAGRLKMAQMELLSLAAECPDDHSIKKKVAYLLLEYQLPTESVQMFREILKNNPQDALSYTGLGQAEFVLGNFQSAEEALRAALRIDPHNGKVLQLLNVIARITVMDPGMRGLKIHERYARSRILMEAVLQSLDRCHAGDATALSAADAQTVLAARKTLSYGGRPHSYGDAYESNLDLAGRCWDIRAKTCDPSIVPDQALAALMSKLLE